MDRFNVVVLVTRSVFEAESHIRSSADDEQSGRHLADDIFKYIFMIRNSTEGCFEGSKWQYVITGSRNGLMRNRWHAITWMDYVKIGHNNTQSELRDGFQSSLCVLKLELVVHIEPQRLEFYSLRGRMSYRKISWSLEATSLGLRLFQSL